MSPWPGIVVIAIGVLACWGFARSHTPELGVAAGIIVCGVSMLHAYTLSATRRELRTLRDSMRPPQDPDATTPVEVPKAGRGR